MKPADDPNVDYRIMVRRGYDRCATRYASIRSHEVEPYVAQLIEMLKKNSKVLDIGCGPGVPIARAFAQLFRVTGVDISGKMISLARVNVPDATIIHADIMEIDLPPLEFDAVILFYVLFHLPKEHHEALLKRIQSWLKVGGYLLLTVAREDEAPYTEEYLGVTMYWSNYGLQEYLKILDELGFEIIKISSVGHGYGTGLKIDEESHPLILAQKNA